jgi:hypothetical protein
MVADDRYGPESGLSPTVAIPQKRPFAASPRNDAMGQERPFCAAEKQRAFSLRFGVKYVTDPGVEACYCS